MLYVKKSTSSVKIKCFQKGDYLMGLNFLQTHGNGYLFCSLPLFFRGLGNLGSQLYFGQDPCRSDQLVTTQLSCWF